MRPLLLAAALLAAASCRTGATLTGPDPVPAAGGSPGASVCDRPDLVAPPVVQATPGSSAAASNERFVRALEAQRRGQEPARYEPRSNDPNVVQLSLADLAPVDAWLSHKTNPQWILGDDVEVVASREYFATALTISSTTSGIVQRTDDMTPAGRVVTLRFRGAKSQAGVMNSPRVLIGTGLTVTARRVLRVHLLKTGDPGAPVHLQVTARGEATRGVRESVVERGEVLALGGTLRRRGGGYAWDVRGRR
jgi:hypothetical protein